MQAVAEVEEDHDESRRRYDKSQWRHDERGARRTLGEGMWSVFTAVRTRVTIFIAPSLPLQGDQAVDAHAARAPAPPYSGGEGLVYRTMCFEGR